MASIHLLDIWDSFSPGIIGSILSTSLTNSSIWLKFSTDIIRYNLYPSIPIKSIIILTLMAVDRFVLLVLQNESSRIKTLFRERSKSVVGCAWAITISLSLYITWSDQNFGICEVAEADLGPNDDSNGSCTYLELKYGQSIAPKINPSCSVETLCLDTLHNFNFTDFANDYEFDYGSEITTNIHQNEKQEPDMKHYDLIYIGSTILLLVAPTFILPFAYAMILLRVRSSAEITHGTPASGIHHVNKLIKMVFIIIGAFIKIENICFTFMATYEIRNKRDEAVFISCWTPFYIQLALTKIFPHLVINERAYQFISCYGFISYFINHSLFLKYTI